MATTSKGPIPEWTVREQLILASAVQRSGDQNWVSVSRAVKPLVEDVRPPDYFSQKNCALQYSAMLDKAKHPKRKRSSDGTPESAVTVEEQIVRQLTEKRMKELSSSITDTRREYHALKKEIEQIDKGELDSELPGMWEKAQAELAMKDTTDSKGSRSRKSSVSAASGASGASPQDQPKRQKVAASAAASGLARDDKARAAGTEKGHTCKSPVSSSHAEAHVSGSVSMSPSKSIKEEKMDITPLSENISLVPTPASSLSSSPSATPSTARIALKKRNFESLPLTGGDAASIVYDESPLPFPMTVPKEEKLQESIAASSGLARSLARSLSPDVHIIVQQPNIAAIAGGGAPNVAVTTSTQETDAKSSLTNAPLLPMPTQPQPQNLQPQPPPVTPQALVVKKEPLAEPVGAASAEVKSVQRRESKDRGEDGSSSLPLKQEVSTVPTAPKTAAEAPSPTVTTTPAIKQSSKPSLPPVTAQLPTPTPTAVPHSTQPPATTSPQHHSGSAKVTVQTGSSKFPSPSPTKVIFPPISSTVSMCHPHTSSSLSPSTQSHLHLTTPPLSTLPPPHPHSTAMTVVSSVLSDPRLSSGIVRSGPTKNAPLRPTVSQVQTTVVKTKPRMMTKSKLSGESDKKGSSGAAAVSVTVAVESLKQLEKDTTRSKERLAKPTDNKSLVRSAWVVEEHKKASSEPSKPAVRLETKQEPRALPVQTPSPEPKPFPTPEVKDASAVEKRTEETEEEVGKAKEEGAVTPEKQAEARVESTSPASPQFTHSSGQKEVVAEERKQIEDMQEISGIDEQVLMDASSSRRSSVSELASSPLAGGPKEEAEGEILPIKGRRQAKPSSSRKLWATRSRKKKLDIDEGMSVGSTDLDSEEEPSSLLTSAAPSPAPSQGDGDQDGGMSKKQWKKAIMLVWRHAAQHKYANLFLHPVRDDDAPGYREVIHRPMDLSSIKRSIENGVITTDIEFQRDMLLMFQNAFMYNSSDHDVYDMAEKMRADVMQSIQDYLSTQLQLIVESSTPKVLRSRDKEGRRGDIHDEGTPTPAKKRRTRADD